jgi:hypothetical protein
MYRVSGHRRHTEGRWADKVYKNINKESIKCAMWRPCDVIGRLVWSMLLLFTLRTDDFCDSRSGGDVLFAGRLGLSTQMCEIARLELGLFNHFAGLGIHGLQSPSLKHGFVLIPAVAVRR